MGHGCIVEAPERKGETVQSIDRLEIFGSPVRVALLPDMDEANAALRAALLAEAKAGGGITRSNVGGWHSKPDLTARAEAPFAPVMKRLVGEIDRTVQELAAARGQALPQGYGFGVHAWAMVLGQGDYVVPHDHADMHLSAAYYVDAGDAPDGAEDSEEDDRPSGRLVFQSPRSAFVPGLDLFPSEFSLRPQTGLMVVFPAYLSHYVHPYRGTRPRICISLNARLEVRG